MWIETVDGNLVNLDNVAGLVVLRATPKAKSNGADAYNLVAFACGMTTVVASGPQSYARRVLRSLREGTLADYTITLSHVHPTEAAQAHEEEA